MNPAVSWILEFYRALETKLSHANILKCVLVYKDPKIKAYFALGDNRYKLCPEGTCILSEYYQGCSGCGFDARWLDAYEKAFIKYPEVATAEILKAIPEAIRLYKELNDE